MGAEEEDVVPAPGGCVKEEDMTREEYREYEDASDIICGQCMECIDEDGEPNGAICDSCPVRKTLDRLYELIES